MVYYYSVGLCRYLGFFDYTATPAPEFGDTNVKITEMIIETYMLLSKNKKQKKCWLEVELACENKSTQQY